MSEPTNRADRVEEILPGVFHWTLHDDRIDFRSDAYAVAAAGGMVLIDPLPLTDEAMARLEPVEAVCLTGAFHQRSAWRLRESHGAPVYLPRGAQRREGEPDHWYGPDEVLPGGLRTVHAPGPTEPHFVFLLEHPGGRNVLFCADLLMRDPAGRLTFVPDEHQDNPAATREAARRVLELPFDVLCPAHGAPETEQGKAAVREALEADRR